MDGCIRGAGAIGEPGHIYVRHQLCHCPSSPFTSTFVFLALWERPLSSPPVRDAGRFPRFLGFQRVCEAFQRQLVAIWTACGVLMLGPCKVCPELA